jgi:CRISPR system Cascade subunit CasE
MYLSKIHLDIANINTRKCLQDCQIMHRSVQRLFHSSRKDSGVLYRLNEQNLDVYILSAIKPDKKDMPDGMSFCGIRDLALLENAFAMGQCYRFDLLASPCKKQEKEGQKNSQRRFLRTPEEREAWLQRKGQQYGFELLQVREEQQVTIHGSHDADHGGKMNGQAVQFQGVLSIQDKDLFRKAWKNGIGPGKSYGQGMLMLRKLD